MLALPRLQASLPDHKASGQVRGKPAQGFSRLLSALLNVGEKAAGKARNPDSARPTERAEAVLNPRPTDNALKAGAKPTIGSAARSPRKADAADGAQALNEAKADRAERRRDPDSPPDGATAIAANALAQRPTRASNERADSGNSTEKPNGDAAKPSSPVEASEGSKKPKVSVVDMRLSAARGGAKRERAEPEAQAAGQDARPIDQQAPRQAPSVEPAPAKAGAPDAAAAEPPAKPASLADSLAARLKEGAADIVRSAQIVLRDGDAGLIRLRLEPESLGSVKIELKMTDKQISGKIVVESDIAGEAFRSSLDSLRDAFAESGFETTSLELEVRNGMAGLGGRGAGSGSGDGADGTGPYFSRSLRSLDESVPQASPLASRTGPSGAVDLIV